VASSLDPDAVARVLARARELDVSVDVDPVGVSPEALIDAAGEVGIDGDAVRRALAIEQLPEVASSGRLDGLAGERAVVVERIVPASPAEALDRVEAWLVSSHRWRCDRRDDSLLARRPPGFAAAAGRLAGSIRAGRRLAGVASVRVDAVGLADGGPSERGRTLVRITADRLPFRQRRLGGGAAVGSAGVGAGALVASEAMVLVPVVAAPAVAAGYLIARTGRAHADHVELELGRLLSAVERGERPGGLVADVVGRARAAVRRPAPVPGRRR
jgi:hypothetical protein